MMSVRNVHHTHGVKVSAAQGRKRMAMEADRDVLKMLRRLADIFDRLAARAEDEGRVRRKANRRSLHEN
jgi:hypothetical protein